MEQQEEGCEPSSMVCQARWTCDNINKDNCHVVGHYGKCEYYNCKK